MLPWLRRWREQDDRSLVDNICAAATLGAMLTVAGCSVEPEPRVVYTRSATTLAKVQLDPVAATAKLNAYRAEKGLNPLRLDPTLTAVAERQAQAMAKSGVMSHDVDGSLSARLAASGINAQIGENLGAGYMSFDDVSEATSSSSTALNHARVVSPRGITGSDSCEREANISVSPDFSDDKRSWT